MRALALLLLLALAPRADAADPRPMIVMGVRVDAPPFAWRDEANDSYLGYLVDICVDAVARADYPAVQVPITPADRLAFFRGERKDLDLLCDPTTVTLDRMADFAALPASLGLEFGPIVFVANGAYVENAGAADTTPASTHGCASGGVPAENAGAAQRFAAGFVVGTTGEQVLREAIRRNALRLAPGATVCPVEFVSHWEAARAFCRGALRYYFGDQDILRSAIAMTREREGCVVVDQSPRPLSYEPYALVATARTPGFRRDFVKALYEVFHHDTAAARFAGNFGGRPMSPALETLFRINKIPQGEAPPPPPPTSRLAAVAPR